MWVLERIVGALGAPGGVKLVGSVTFKVLRGFPKMSYAPRVRFKVKKPSLGELVTTLVTKRTTTAVKCGKSD